MRRFFLLLLVIIISGCSIGDSSEPRTDTKANPDMPVAGESTSEYIIFGKKGNNQGVYAVNIENNKDIRTIYTGKYTTLDAAEDRVLIFVGSDERDVSSGTFIVCNFKGNALARIKPGSEVREDIKPVISPDGRRIIYVNEKNNMKFVYHIDVDSREITKLEALGGDIRDISFKNDDVISYSKAYKGYSQIYEFNLKFYEERRVFESKAYDISPSYSSDGTRLAFLRNENGNNNLYIKIISNDFEAPMPIYKLDDVLEGSIKWSKDNNFLTFTIAADNGERVMVYDVERDGFRELEESFTSVFSIKGDSIAYAEYKSEKKDDNKEMKVYIYKKMLRGRDAGKLYEAEEVSLFGKSLELLTWIGDI